MFSLKNPEFFEIQSPDGPTCGADQEWYPEVWQRRSGCGPTTWSNMLWYLSKTTESLTPLWPEKRTDRAAMLELMELSWTYITPTKMGVNKTSIFTEGLERFGNDRGIALSSTVLEVPVLRPCRPSWEEVAAFLRGAFQKDTPVAFLNLGRGSLQNLDSWHWVTLVGMEEGSTLVTMVDAGRCTRIDLGQWLTTAALGGGFVTLA